jgi:hypothetical protein
MNVSILNLGAGVQSTTLYLMAEANWKAHRAGLPLPFPEVGLIDVSIFADTQDEPEDVYKHLRWLRRKARHWKPNLWHKFTDWLFRRKGPPILVRTKGKLSDDLKRGVNSTGQRVASIPAYTKGDEPNARIGRVRRQCTKEYKIEVIERCIRREIIGLKPRQRVPQGVTVRQIFGISTDEAGRATRHQERIEEQKIHWLVIDFPLLTMGMNRAECENFLELRVPHTVPKSACVFCPFHDPLGWLRIKANPRDWKLAVETDEALRIPGNVVNRKMDAKLYLHRSCQPLVQIDFTALAAQQSQQQSFPFNQECEGMCGV